jgi:peptidoglycan/xylan/chitin deacetylase (PgdA/CDA1 family)
MRRIAMLLAFTVCIQWTIVDGTRAEVYKDPATLLYRIDTKDPVVFITIDDGKDRPADAEAVLNRLKWPITSFLVPKLVHTHAQWFAQLSSVNDIGSHTAQHIALKGLSFKKQKDEICRGEGRMLGKFGKTTGYFRPPYGLWDPTTLKAAAACGITHVFLWRVSLNGRTITTWGGNIRAGDIIIIHYVGSLAQSLRRLERELKRLKLTPARLSDYVK